MCINGLAQVVIENNKQQNHPQLQTNVHVIIVSLSLPIIRYCRVWFPDQHFSCDCGQSTLGPGDFTLDLGPSFLPMGQCGSAVCPQLHILCHRQPTTYHGHLFRLRATVDRFTVLVCPDNYSNYCPLPKV